MRVRQYKRYSINYFVTNVLNDVLINSVSPSKPKIYVNTNQCSQHTPDAKEKQQQHKETKQNQEIV